MKMYVKMMIIAIQKCIKEIKTYYHDINIL